MNPKILLFDFDGTIADTADAAVRIYNAIARENGYTLITKENLPSLRNMSALDNIRYLGVSMLKVPFIAKQVRSMLKSEVPDLKPISGIVEPLRLLKDKGHRLYIVSSNSKENILSFLEHNQIEVFNDVYSVFDLFGKHTKITELMTANHWDTSSVLYIGDEVRDIDAAKKAGVKAVAVTWGFNGQEALLKSSPDVLLNDPSELSSL